MAYSHNKNCLSSRKQQGGVVAKSSYSHVYCNVRLFVSFWVVSDWQTGLFSLGEY